jgi:hypothetical protein
MRFFAVVLVSALCAACADQGRVYPLDDASLRAGIPKVEFTRYGLGHGPITITMPDGEVLQGEYQVTENEAVAVGFAGGRMATALGTGGGRPVVANAIGNRGSIMNCEGVIDLGGHGSLICHSNRGLSYRLMV